MAQKAASVSDVKQLMGANFQADKAAGVEAIFQFDLSGADDGQFWILVQNNSYQVGEGMHSDPTITFSAQAEDFLAVANGEMAAMAAFMAGKLKVKGDMGLALKFQSIFPTN